MKRSRPPTYRSHARLRAGTLPGRGPGPRGASAADATYRYLPDFVDAGDALELHSYLGSLHPIWEMRYGSMHPPPAGRPQHQLRRPVYWLGNWQFACLGYYEPPRRISHCAVRAEPFPEVLATLVRRVERLVRSEFPPAVVPPRWHLNTCLVNFYGSAWDGARWVDVARVGAHRDFEPGPVASLSLGERARFQFVRPGPAAAPVRTEWLADRSMQVFAGPQWKDLLLHHVQRVENKLRQPVGPTIDRFRTRRINLTFRYVPDEHICNFRSLPAAARDDVASYMRELAAHSPFFAAELD